MNEEVKDDRIKTPDKLIEVQTQLDARNNAFIAQLDEIDQGKYAAVKKALVLLGEAGVPVTLFAMLPNHPRYIEQGSTPEFVDDLRKYSMGQYNNSTYFIDLNNNSYFPNKDKVLLSYWNLGLIMSIVNYVRVNIVDPKMPPELTPVVMGNLANIAQAFYYRGVIPDEWKDLVNEDGTYRSDDIPPVPDCPSRVRSDVTQEEIKQAILNASEGSKKMFDQLPEELKTQILPNE